MVFGPLGEASLGFLVIGLVGLEGFDGGSCGVDI